jgi:hypothetical protein
VAGAPRPDPLAAVGFTGGTKKFWGRRLSTPFPRTGWGPAGLAFNPRSSEPARPLVREAVARGSGEGLPVWDEVRPALDRTQVSPPTVSPAEQAGGEG